MTVNKGNVSGGGVGMWIDPRVSSTNATLQPPVFARCESTFTSAPAANHVLSLAKPPLSMWEGEIISQTGIFFFTQ